MPRTRELIDFDVLERSYLVETDALHLDVPVNEKIQSVLDVHFERVAKMYADAPTPYLADDELAARISSGPGRPNVIIEANAVSGAVSQLVEADLRAQRPRPYGDHEAYKAYQADITATAHHKARKIAEQIIAPQLTGMRLFTVCSRVDAAIAAGEPAAAIDLEAFSVLAGKVSPADRGALADKYVADMAEKTHQAALAERRTKTAPATEVATISSEAEKLSRQARETHKAAQALGGPLDPRAQQVAQLLDLTHRVVDGKPVTPKELITLLETTKIANRTAPVEQAGVWQHYYKTALKGVVETLSVHHYQPVVRDNLKEVLQHVGATVEQQPVAAAPTNIQPASPPKIPAQQSTKAESPVAPPQTDMKITVTDAANRSNPANLIINAPDSGGKVVELSDMRNRRGKTVGRLVATAATTAVFIGGGAMGANAVQAAESTQPAANSAPDIRVLTTKDYKNSLDSNGDDAPVPETVANTDDSSTDGTTTEANTAPSVEVSTSLHTGRHAQSQGRSAEEQPDASAVLTESPQPTETASNSDAGTQQQNGDKAKKNQTTSDVPQPADGSLTTPSIDPTTPAESADGQDTTNKGHDKNDASSPVSSETPSSPSDQTQNSTDPTNAAADPIATPDQTGASDNGQNNSKTQLPDQKNDSHGKGQQQPEAPIDPSDSIQTIVEGDDDTAQAVHGAAKHAEITQETAADGADILVVNNPELEPSKNMPTTVLPEVEISITAPDPSVPSSSEVAPEVGAPSPNAIDSRATDDAASPAQDLADGSTITVDLPNPQKPEAGSDSLETATNTVAEVNNTVLSSTYSNPGVPASFVASQVVGQLVDSGEQPVDRPAVEAKVGEFVSAIEQHGVADPANADAARNLHIASMVGVEMPQTAPTTTTPQAYEGNPEAQQYKDILAPQVHEAVFGENVPGADAYTSDQQAEIVASLVNAETLSHSLDEIHQALIDAGVIQEPEAVTPSTGDQSSGNDSGDQGSSGKSQEDKTDTATEIIQAKGGAWENIAAGLQFYMDHGYSLAQSSGLLANFKAESGVDPGKEQYGGGPGRGLAQWEKGGRWNTLVRFAEERGLDPKKLDTQLKFTIFELEGNESRANELLKQANTPKEAALIVSKFYERPNPVSAHNDLRAEFAQTINDVYERARHDAQKEADKKNDTKHENHDSSRGEFHTSDRTLEGAQKVLDRAEKIVDMSQNELDRICSDGADNACYKRCARLAARAWGRESAGYESAAVQWEAMQRRGEAHVGDRDVPIGALLFYNTGQEYGHVAVYLGHGKVLTNDVLDSVKNTKGGAYITDAKQLEGDRWNIIYQGWAPPDYDTALIN